MVNLIYATVVPCKVPHIAHGTFYMGGKALFFLEMKYHGTSIELRCSKGYVLKGPSKSHCWYGEWDLSDAPECIPGNYVCHNNFHFTLKFALC